MAQKLPYLATPGTVPKVLDKIIEAKTPERFTIDFLGTRLGFSGGSARPIIPLLKRIGLLTDDGTPTELYSKFRTERGRGIAMATALRMGYDELFMRNEYAHALQKEALKDLIYEITGAEKGNTATECMVTTFLNLKEYADFDIEAPSSEVLGDVNSQEPPPIENQNYLKHEPKDHNASGSRTFGLSYTININLPETKDVEVYNAIFEAIEKKLLK